MLQGLDEVPWADLEHAYGSAADVPALLRKLLDHDPKIRSKVLNTLYGNVFHQGTRYLATCYVIPFLIEICASPNVPKRGDLLRFWGSLITGYFSVQERPCWGDGERVYSYGKAHKPEPDDSRWGDYPATLHQIYQESLKGYEVACRLLADEDPGVRAGAAWVLACMPTMDGTSVPKLERKAAPSRQDGSVLRSRSPWASLVRLPHCSARLSRIHSRRHAAWRPVSFADRADGTVA